jgi:hypothetical protein
MEKHHKLSIHMNKLSTDDNEYLSWKYATGPLEPKCIMYKYTLISTNTNASPQTSTHFKE